MMFLQVGWFTADNAGNNRTALQAFGKLLPDPLFDAEQRYIRYVDIDLRYPTHRLITFGDVWNIPWISPPRLS